MLDRYILEIRSVFDTGYIYDILRIGYGCVS